MNKLLRILLEHLIVNRLERKLPGHFYVFYAVARHADVDEVRRVSTSAIIFRKKKKEKRKKPANRQKFLTLAQLYFLLMLAAFCIPLFLLPPLRWQVKQRRTMVTSGHKRSLGHDFYQVSRIFKLMSFVRLLFSNRKVLVHLANSKPMIFRTMYNQVTAQSMFFTSTTKGRGYKQTL